MSCVGMSSCVGKYVRPPKLRMKMKLRLFVFDIHCWLKRQRQRLNTENLTEVFGKGYRAGYNQALVDKGFLTQAVADERIQA